jgi:septal ring factor EnvC (AmiA/AmiB activator)
MSDLKVPYPAKVLANLEIQIDEQYLVIKRKKFRLMEIEEEKENIAKDIAASESQIQKLQAEKAQQEAMQS